VATRLLTARKASAADMVSSNVVSDGADGAFTVACTVVDAATSLMAPWTYARAPAAPDYQRHGAAGLFWSASATLPQRR
jgi:hypothetical protein